MDRQARNASKGCSSVIMNLRLPRILKPSSASVSPFSSAAAPTMLSAMSWLQESGWVSSRVNVYSTSDAVSGEPLLKVTPSRR